eukprot:14090434-Alexandrium_andersonii.AAC.1
MHARCLAPARTKPTSWEAAASWEAATAGRLPPAERLRRSAPATRLKRGVCVAPSPTWDRTRSGRQRGGGLRHRAGRWHRG